MIVSIRKKMRIEMMMLVSPDAEMYKRIKKLYKTAFPRNERAPFFMIKGNAIKGKADMFAAVDEGEFVGFTYVVTHKDMAYLFYFAVSKDKRGSGNGSKILGLIKERYHDKRLFLAREQLDETAPNSEERIKRHEFYLKNGFVDYPYRLKELSVIYDVMGIGGSVEPDEYDALITGWCGKLIRKFVDMRIIAD